MTEGRSRTMSNEKTVETFDMKKGLSIYQKIFLNYIQMIAIINGLDLKWPNYLKDFYNVFTNVSGASGQLVSLDCILYDHGFQGETIYPKTILTILFPFAIIFMAFLIIFLLYLVKKKRNQINRFFSAVIITSVFFQPSIIQKLYQILSCKTMGKTKFISSVLTIECYTDDYNYWVLFFKIFILFFLVLKFRQIQLCFPFSFFGFSFIQEDSSSI